MDPFSLSPSAGILVSSAAQALPEPSGADRVKPGLVDRLGRRISYLRLSITDRCDFRCTYCMTERVRFLPRKSVLSLEECLRLVRVFADLGVTKVRITGGEPLVRRNALWLLERIARLPGVEELVLTTNGSQLERYAPALRRAGVGRLNVSLDTLDPERFRALTRTGRLDQVLAGLDAVAAAGFTHTKLNTVLLRGVNDQELATLVDFALARELDISFIEEMPLGDIGHGRETTFFSSEAALAHLQERFTLVPTAETSGGPARYWRIPGEASRIGFISPHSHNFCDTCNRIRVTARGELFPCLGHNDAVPLMPLLRGGDGDTAVQTAIRIALGIKPDRHHFGEQMLRPQVVRFMSATGG